MQKMNEELTNQDFNKIELNKPNISLFHDIINGIEARELLFIDISRISIPFSSFARKPPEIIPLNRNDSNFKKILIEDLKVLKEE